MNDKLQAKLDNIKANPVKAPVASREVWVPNIPQHLLNNYSNEHNFDKRIIDLVITLREKVQMIMFGKPLIVEHSSDAGIEKAKDRTSYIFEEMELQEALYAQEAIVFDKFRSYIVLEKVGKKIVSRVAEPQFPNRIVRLGKTKVKAEIWTSFMYDIAKYFRCTTYTYDKITTDWYQAGAQGFEDKKKVSLKEMKEVLGKDIKGTMPNPYGFIPVEDLTYMPTLDYSWYGQYNIAPATRLEGLQQMLDQATKMLQKELWINRSKILVDQDILTNNKEILAKIATEDILAILKDTGGVDGDKGKVVEQQMGDPKVESYWLNITNIISLAIQTLKLSELQSEGSATATGEIFDKANDIENVNTRKTYTQRKIARILEMATLMKSGKRTDEEDIDPSEWSVQIVPNVIMNEAKITDMVIAQLGANLVSQAGALVKLEGISYEDALAKLKKMESEETLNPTLEATKSFSEDYEAPNTNEVQKTNEPKPE